MSVSDTLYHINSRIPTPLKQIDPEGVADIKLAENRSKTASLPVILFP